MAIGIGTLGPAAPVATAAPIAVGVPVLVQQTETPPPSVTDPESGTDAEAESDTEREKSQRKLVVGLVALGLLVVVLWGRRIRKQRREQKTTG